MSDRASDIPVVRAADSSSTVVISRMLVDPGTRDSMFRDPIQRPDDVMPLTTGEEFLSPVTRALSGSPLSRDGCTSREQALNDPMNTTASPPSCGRARETTIVPEGASDGRPLLARVVPLMNESLKASGPQSLTTTASGSNGPEAREPLRDQKERTSDSSADMQVVAGDGERGIKRMHKIQ